MTGMMWSVLEQATMDEIVSRRAARRRDLVRHGAGLRAPARRNALSPRRSGHADVEPGGVVVATKWLPILKPASDITRTIGERMECLRAVSHRPVPGAHPVE